MMLRCDGCGHDTTAGDMAFPSADGHSAKYCRDCHGVYEAFVKAVQAQEASVNRALALWIEETRRQVSLQYMPQDAPPIIRRPVGKPLVLG